MRVTRRGLGSLAASGLTTRWARARISAASRVATTPIAGFGGGGRAVPVTGGAVGCGGAAGGDAGGIDAGGLPAVFVAPIRDSPRDENQPSPAQTIAARPMAIATAPGAKRVQRPLR